MVDFSPVAAYMEALRAQGVPGCEVMVSHHGRPVYRYLTGWADAAHTRPVTADTLYFMYSCSKPVTIIAAMQLAESDKLALDAPVAAYLPEFTDACYWENDRRIRVGDSLTLRHLCTMSAGLDYDLTSPEITALRRQLGDQATTRRMMPALAKHPLHFRPGARYQYSLCLDVLGAVIEVASGQTLGEYMREHIFAPLGMRDTTFHPTAEQFSRIAEQYAYSPETGLPERMAKSIGDFALCAGFESGGAGLVSCTADYARLATAMACGGVAADGTRILSEASIDQIRRPHIGSFVESPEFNCPIGAGYSYGLGVRTLTDPAAVAHGSKGEFGWDGAAGSFILMDPATEIAIVYTQQVHGWITQLGGIHAPLRDKVYAALGY